MNQISYGPARAGSDTEGTGGRMDPKQRARAIAAGAEALEAAGVGALFGDCSDLAEVVLEAVIPALLPEVSEQPPQRYEICRDPYCDCPELRRRREKLRTALDFTDASSHL